MRHFQHLWRFAYSRVACNRRYWYAQSLALVRKYELHAAESNITYYEFLTCLVELASYIPRKKILPLWTPAAETKITFFAGKLISDRYAIYVDDAT